MTRIKFDSVDWYVETGWRALGTAMGTFCCTYSLMKADLGLYEISILLLGAIGAFLIGLLPRPFVGKIEENEESEPNSP